MKTYLLAYVVTALIFLGMDAIWLGTMAKLLYRPMLGPLLLEKFNVGPALAFYALYVAGIIYFAIMPAFASGRWQTALVHGAAFGLVAYATYDLTNMATLKHWPALVTWADLAWGTIVTCVSATLGYLVVTWLLPPAT